MKHTQTDHTASTASAANLKSTLITINGNIQSHGAEVMIKRVLPVMLVHFGAELKKKKLGQAFPNFMQKKRQF